MLCVTLDRHFNLERALKKLIPILFLLFTNVSFGQTTFKPIKIRKSIWALTKQFPVYSDTLFPKYLDNLYDTIFKKATISELYELTNHPNPCVRRSAFYSMLSKYSAKTLDLINKNSSDTTQWFYVQYGCMIEQQTFVDEMLFYLSPQSGWDRNFKMTQKQKDLVQTMIKRREKERRDYFFSH